MTTEEKAAKFEQIESDLQEMVLGIHPKDAATVSLHPGTAKALMQKWDIKIKED